MRVEDLKVVLSIERRAYESCWTEGIFRDCLQVGYSCWVYEADRRIEVYAVMSTAAREAHVLNLCVRPESQGRGLGRRMLSQLVRVARTRNVDTVLLEVRPSNHRALRLYLDFGFNEIGERRGYYPGEKGREDALVLGLSLV